jgi:hypothetical protein
LRIALQNCPGIDPAEFLILNRLVQIGLERGMSSIEKGRYETLFVFHGLVPQWFQIGSSRTSFDEIVVRLILSLLVLQSCTYHHSSVQSFRDPTFGVGRDDQHVIIRGCRRIGMLGYHLLARIASCWSLDNIANKVGDGILVLLDIPNNHVVWIVMAPFIVDLLRISEGEGPSSIHHIIEIGEIGFARWHSLHLGARYFDVVCLDADVQPDF